MTETVVTGWTLTFEEADPDAVDLLGGKGAGLARMSQAGLRVPPGYVISTRACREFLRNDAVPEDLPAEVLSQLRGLEERSGKSFGSGPNPLLLSVRSGAPVSMPGMMDTVLNLGLSRDVAVAMAEVTGDTRFVADLVARFHAMYAETVLGAVDTDAGAAQIAAGVDRRADAAEVYDRLWQTADDAVLADVGHRVPTDPYEQLLGAIEAVFRSWNTRRAKTYREFHKIPHDLGTAVVVQSMVFGNLSDDSGSGVVFTRNPVSGEPVLYGEFLSHSQGEDVVAGIRTPDPLPGGLAPVVYRELAETCAELERQQADVLDIEFTVERSRLYFLQVRIAKRTPQAAVRIAADFLQAGVVAPARALRTLSAEQVRQVQRPGFDPDELERSRAAGRLLTTGIGACPGQVSGELVLDSERAEQRAHDSRPVVLARPVTSPADLHGMIAARGIVTATGGSTSHAAVVARALGKACVVGCSAATIDPDAGTLVVGDRTIREGEVVSVDGTTGELFLGAMDQSAPPASASGLQSVMDVARAAAGCEVFGRVTLPGDVRLARENGASGLVTAVDDVLAATGHLDELVQSLLRQRDVSRIRLQDIEDFIADEFAPLLARAGELPVGVRAIDFVADESRELLQQTPLTTHYPELSVPLGLPALVEAQLVGLARAAKAARNAGPVHLAVRHVTDPAEAVELRRLHERVSAQRGLDGEITLGGYLTSPRGAVNIDGIAAVSDAVWVEVRVLQATMFGIPARQLLTQHPLDEYVQRGMLSTDPRSDLDPSVETLLATIAEAGRSHPGCRLGMRLSGIVAEDVVRRLHRLGFRRFAVDAYETRPTMLALGKAALGAY
jgi:pyruvate, orthophosphate dikinase